MPIDVLIKLSQITNPLTGFPLIDKSAKSAYNFPTRSSRLFGAFEEPRLDYLTEHLSNNP